MARTTHPLFLALPLAASLGLPASAQDAAYPTCIDAMEAPCILSDGTLLEAEPIPEGEVPVMPPPDMGGVDPATIDPMTGLPLDDAGTGTYTDETQQAPADQGVTEPMPMEPGYAEPMPADPGMTELELSEPDGAAEEVQVPDGAEILVPGTEPVYPEEPAYVEPNLGEPMPAEPEYAEPEYVEPAQDEPIYVEPEGTDPASIEQAPMEPVYVEPEATDPVATQEPVAEEPTQDPSVDVPPVDPTMEPTTEFLDPMTGEVVTVPEWDPAAESTDPTLGGEPAFDPILEPTEEPVQPEQPLDGAVAPDNTGTVDAPMGTDTGADGDAFVPAEPTTEAPVAEEPTTTTVDPAVDGTVGGVDAGGDAGFVDPAVVAPEGQAVEEVYVPDAPAVIEAQEEAAADPEVQASVEALEQSFTAPPQALAGDGAEAGAVLGTAERIIDRARDPGQEYRGGVMALGGDRDSARAQAARDREERRDRMESAGLGFIAGLVVGAIINDRQEVVATTPERIVVIDRTTNVYQVWRDDDVLLRRPGTQETIRTYRDGSTQTILVTNDGTTVETIRDATGRVVWRQRTEGDRRVILIDERRPVGTIDIRVLPEPRVREIRIPNGIDPTFGAELVRSSGTPVDRFFTLGQIRNVAQVRSLAPALATDPVLFASGSAALDPRQAGALSGLAGVMLAMLEDNPAEVFLVEGHTDAVGSAAFNLALSDRRAETVASALVEYFGVPPENLVFQGYGEALLKVRTTADEPRNRRVEIRRITPLLAQDN